MTDTNAAGSGLNLQKVQPRILRQEVLSALRTAILANEITAGSRLLEADVAAQMGVSRAPVREAIRHLEQEGLIEIFPHRGAVVIGLPEAEIDAIYELRSVIEGRATAAAVDVVGEAELARLEALIDEMRAAIKARDVEAIAEFDLQFHGLIVDLSGLTLLRHIWSSLDGLVRVRSFQALDRPGSTARYFLKNAATLAPGPHRRAARAGTGRRRRRSPGNTSSRCRRCWPDWAGRGGRRHRRAPRGDAGS